MNKNEDEDLIRRLPHVGRMRLVDSIVRIDKDSAETRTQLNPSRIELFGRENEVETYLGIELIAQSSALPLIYRTGDRKEHQGMIVQVRSFRSYSILIDASAGLTTRCTVELMLDEKVASATGQVLNGESIVCEAVITLAMKAPRNDS